MTDLSRIPHSCEAGNLKMTHKDSCPMVTDSGLDPHMTTQSDI
jgi:hypothetical protein